MISDFGMGNSEFIKRLKGFFALFVPHSALRIPHLAKLLIPQSVLRIPHSMRYFSVGQQSILFLLALLILALIYHKFYYRPASPPEEVYQEIVVEVLGEVKNPGIYIFKNPPTLIEAVEKAGGLKESVRFEGAQSSEVLKTGTLLNASKESPKEIKITLGRMEANKLLAFSIPLDLNRVSVEDLCLIPGIGQSLAREIVTTREKRRRFRSIEELKSIKGIGEKNFNSIKRFFIVRL
jgi:competence protein ComEA